MDYKKIKAIIILTVFIDVVGLGIIIPILPFYVESFNVSSFVVTLLFSVFALCSFVSGPFLGALSDRVGRRPILIVSIASTAIGWFVFASAHTVWILFLGRIIDGMAAGNFPIAQSYLVDIARNDKERTTNLGIIGAIFGIGFIVGPAMGALLSGISPALPFWFVGALASLNFIGAYFFLPETHKNLNLKKKISINPLLPIKNAITDKLLRSRYLVWLLFGTAFSSMQSIIGLYLKDVFNFSAILTGYVFTGMGIILVLNQTIGLKKIWLKYFNEKKLEIYFFLIMTTGFILADIKIVWIFALGLFFITLAQSTLRVVISSVVVGVAGQFKRGETMGIMASIMSVSMIVGPLLGGVLFQKNVSWPFLANAVLLLSAFFIMKRCCGNEKITEEVTVEAIG